jgi:glycosyltransferase involved in cell wall biosynthesis
LGAIDNGNPSGVPKEEVDEAVEAGILNYLGTTNDVVKVIKEADCIVLPSYREGVSRVLMEAASMEKPIIATNVAGCREVVDEGLTGFLCKAKNSFDLAYKMATLINLSEEERELMGKRARQKIVDEMDLERVIEIYDIKTTQIITGEKEGLTVNLEELLRVKQRKNI